MESRTVDLTEIMRVRQRVGRVVGGGDLGSLSLTKLQLNRRIPSVIRHTSVTVGIDYICLSQKVRRNYLEYFQHPEKYSLVINVRGGKFVYLTIHVWIKASRDTPLLCKFLFYILLSVNLM